MDSLRVRSSMCCRRAAEQVDHAHSFPSKPGLTTGVLSKKAAPLFHWELATEAVGYCIASIPMLRYAIHHAQFSQRYLLPIQRESPNGTQAGHMHKKQILTIF